MEGFTKGASTTLGRCCSNTCFVVRHSFQGGIMYVLFRIELCSCRIFLMAKHPIFWFGIRWNYCVHLRHTSSCDRLEQSSAAEHWSCFTATNTIDTAFTHCGPDETILDYIFQSTFSKIMPLLIFYCYLLSMISKSQYRFEWGFGVEQSDRPSCVNWNNDGLVFWGAYA